jgi:hypothetical protein
VNVAHATIGELLAIVPDVDNLSNCVEEVRQAALDGETGPPDPLDFSNLRGRLEAARTKLPPLYRDEVHRPYVDTLNTLGSSQFTEILLSDPRRERTAGLMMDIAHAILQNGEQFQELATDAFQEVVSDLYDGFLSAEDRRGGIRPPDRGVIAPLVKWGNPTFGPYTWPVDAAESFGVGAGIVSLPPAHARRGLLAWAALGHETAGHDILRADTGLLGELTQAVRNALTEAGIGKGLPDYWASRMDETASDIMGILNMGPAAAIGLVGYFRGLNGAFGGDPSLRTIGVVDDPHPADILRGYLGAAAVRSLSFGAADAWADEIEKQTDNDAQGRSIRINARINSLGQRVDDGTVLTRDEARNSAALVAQTLITHKAEHLETHSLGDIQDWGNDSELIVQRLRQVLNSVMDLPDDLASGIFAAHIVAAATIEALSKDAVIPLIFARMIAMLKIMHDKNPSWGPLFITHPGNLYRERTYVPLRIAGDALD